MENELAQGDKVIFRGAPLAGTGKIVEIALNQGVVSHLVEWDYGGEGFYAPNQLEKVTTR